MKQIGRLTVLFLGLLLLATTLPGYKVFGQDKVIELRYASQNPPQSSVFNCGPELDSKDRERNQRTCQNQTLLGRFTYFVTGGNERIGKRRR